MSSPVPSSPESSLEPLSGLPSTTSPKAATITAITGASGVALGAFGAHALKAQLLASQRLDTWETAVFYHLTHALLLALLAHRFPNRRLPFRLCLAGIILFSGSLYLLCLTPWTFLGPITPIGGCLLIAAWLCFLTPPPSERSPHTHPTA